MTIDVINIRYGQRDSNRHNGEEQGCHSYGESPTRGEIREL